MAFPTSPTDGDIYVKGSTPYIYSSTNNSWTETTDANLLSENIKSGVSILGVSGELSSLSNIYISPLEHFRNIGYYTNGYYVIGTYYCFNVGNFIYTPIFYSNNGFDPATINVGMMKISLDSSEAVSVSWGNQYSVSIFARSITSQYLDGGKCYFNHSEANKYVYFDTSDNSWTYNQNGQYTSGLKIDGHLELNGLKYEPVIQLEVMSGSNDLISVKTKVTKL